MSYEDSMGLKLLFYWDDIVCYDVLYKHLIVTRGYELIVYIVIGVTNRVFEF